MAGIRDGDFIHGEDLLSFLMIGQSNMAGRGNFEDVPPIKNNRCYMMRNGRFLRLSEPINPDRAIFDPNFHSGIGPGGSFADELAKNTNSRVGLIPCADGGTNISQWQPGEILYEHAVFMARLAKRTSTFAGFIWHQGESDCTRDEDVIAYKPKLINMINSMRRDLDAEDLPFIMGELCEDIVVEWNEGCRTARLNKVLYEIANELPNVAVVSAKGFTLKPDGIHFDSVSQREFGKRYFEKYMEMTKR